MVIESGLHSLARQKNRPIEDGGAVPPLNSDSGAPPLCHYIHNPDLARR